MSRPTYVIPRPDWVSDALVADRGENAGFQMYSTEGNDQVAHAIYQVVAAAEEQHLRRAETVRRLNLTLGILAQHYPEVNDTEPQWAIVDALQPYFAEQGWVQIGRDDLD